MKRGILPWILVLFPLAFLRAQPRADSQEAAAKIWEQMIDAKGGRRHLYQIETIVQETHGYWIIFSRKFKSGAERGVTVYAFPDRVWSWYSGPIFGGSSHVADLSAGIGYYGFPNNDIRKTDDFRGDKQHLKETQLVYFNETQWLKPKLLRTLLGKSIPRKVEAIETDVDGERFDDTEVRVNGQDLAVGDYGVDLLYILLRERRRAHQCSEYATNQSQILDRCAHHRLSYSTFRR